MKRLTLSRCGAVLALAVALAPPAASAQQADTLSISGAFNMDAVSGILGADLAEVYANDNEHWWTLTLYGVTYSHETYSDEWVTELGNAYDRQFVTRVHATSLNFEFFGPDAEVLNQVVSQQLIKGSLGNDAFFELWNGDYYEPEFWWDSGPYGGWFLELSPLDPAVGVSFSAYNWWTSPFSADESGYPLVEPQRTRTVSSAIVDNRSGNYAALQSTYDVVDIGSAEPPLPPSLKVLDGSVLEVDKGTNRLDLTVTLSRINSDMVTVNYTTASGTALVNKDYCATSGTLAFSPGQTQGTISVAIKGDRKREGDETFSVRLSGAVSATIDDGVATATILNDD
jgi:hypothetical protein